MSVIYTVLWMDRDQMGSASVVAPPGEMPGSLTWLEIAPESLSPPGKALEMLNPVAVAPGSLIPPAEESGLSIPPASAGCPAKWFYVWLLDDLNLFYKRYSNCSVLSFFSDKNGDLVN